MAIIDLYLDNWLRFKVRLQTKPFKQKIAENLIFAVYFALDASQRLRLWTSSGSRESNLSA
jgi:hypothetical protein